MSPRMTAGHLTVSGAARFRTSLAMNLKAGRPQNCIAAPRSRLARSLVRVSPSRELCHRRERVVRSHGIRCDAVSGPS